MSKNVLIVAAHPDDEVLGCGGTIAKLVKQKHNVYTLILGEGKTSRIANDFSIKEELSILNQEIIQANKILGITKVYTRNFPDNKFDTVALLDIVKEIEEIKEEVNPEIIYTHHFGDMNIDHQVTLKAVLTATRPMKNECVKEIYSFEIPSSTEWGSFSAGSMFIPNIFQDISDTIDIKVKAMGQYKSELREYPHPRSLQHIKELARVNGTKVGLSYSENFVLLRQLRG